MVREKIAKAKETVKHAEIIIEDMRKNRQEYSSKDLSWRNVDLMGELINSINDLSDALEALVDQGEGRELEPEQEKTAESPVAERYEPEIGTKDEDAESEEGRDEGNETGSSPEAPEATKKDKPSPSAPKVSTPKVSK